MVLSMPPPCLQDLHVGGPLQFALEFLCTVAGKDQVRVRVYEAGAYHLARRIDLPGSTIFAAQVGRRAGGYDLAIGHSHGAIGEGSYIGQRGAALGAPWAGASNQLGSAVDEQVNWLHG